MSEEFLLQLELYMLSGNNTVSITGEPAAVPSN